MDSTITRKVGDKVMAYRNHDCTDRSPDNWAVATIKKIYKVNMTHGVLEYADILFDGDDAISKAHFTTFLNRKV